MVTMWKHSLSFFMSVKLGSRRSSGVTAPPRIVSRNSGTEFTASVTSHVSA